LRTLILSILSFVKENFNLKLYLSVVFVTALLIFVEYKWHFYDNISMKWVFDNKVYLFNFIVFAFSYYMIVALVRLFGKTKISLNKEFWLKSIAGLMILSVYISYFGHYGIGVKLGYPQIYYYYYTSENLSGIVTMLLPLFLVYLIFDRNKEIPFYGFSFKNFNYKIAALLTIIAVAISFAGSFFDSLLEYYPILNRTAYKSFSQTTGINPVISASVFESAYLFDFMMIELFFRGFMIFGFIRLLGKDAILPVATLYAVIHFGKPLPETVSSFFGAYVLGIVAYSQKNIGIGIVLHCALALSMEIFTLI